MRRAASLPISSAGCGGRRPVTAGHRQRCGHPDPDSGGDLCRCPGPLSLRSTEPGGTPAGLIGSPSARDRSVGPRPVEPSADRGAHLAGRRFRGNHAERGGRHPDRRHLRIPRRQAGPGGAALRRCLDGVPGTAAVAHHHVRCRPGSAAAHRGAGGRRRRGRLARGQRRGGGHQGQRLLPGSQGRGRAHHADPGAPRPAQYRGAPHHRLQHQRRVSSWPRPA